MRSGRKRIEVSQGRLPGSNRDQAACLAGLLMIRKPEFTNRLNLLARRLCGQFTMRVSVVRPQEDNDPIVVKVTRIVHVPQELGVLRDSFVVPDPEEPEFSGAAT
jgi:hypothetical protein